MGKHAREGLGNTVAAMALLAALLVAGAASAGAGKEQVDPFEGFNELRVDDTAGRKDTDVHLPEGPLRTLFVAPRFTMRDAVELARRLELAADHVMLWDAQHVGRDSNRTEPPLPGASREDTLARLRELLAGEHDLLVIGNVDMAILPLDIVAAAARKIEAGCGLVVSSYGHEALSIADVFPGLTRADAPPWFQQSADATVSCYTLDQGRVVELGWPGNRAVTHFLLPETSGHLSETHGPFDACYSLPMHALRWAAGRDPSLYIEGVEDLGVQRPDPSTIPPNLSTEEVQGVFDQVARASVRPYMIHLNGAASQPCLLETRLRREGSPVRAVARTTLASGQDRCRVDLPAGPGRYSLEVLLLDRKERLLDWRTETLTVQGWPEFSELLASKSVLRPNDTLTLRTYFRPLMLEPRAFVVYARATDAFNRVVSETYVDVSIDAGYTEIEMEFADLIAPRVSIEAFALEIYDRNPDEVRLGMAACATLSMPVRVPAKRNDFTLWVSGDITGEHNALGFLDVLAGAGVDAVVTQGRAVAGIHLAGAGLCSVLTLGQYSADFAREGLVRSPCLTDPAYLGRETEKLGVKAEALAPYASGLFSLGAGNCIVGSDENACQSPTCLEGFREVLKTEYKTLGALNATWKSNWSSWDAIRPRGQDEAASSHAYASWVDFRSYMDSVFAGFHGAAREAIRKGEARSLAGLRAISNPGPYAGYDWSTLAPELDFIGFDADPVTMAQLRSYMLPRTFAGVSAEPVSLAQARWAPWRAVLHGMSGLWLDAAYGGSDAPGPFVPLAPDGQPFPLFSALAEETGRIKKGIGKVLMRARRKSSLIAIYDSRATYYLDALSPTGQASMGVQQAQCMRALEDLGYQYDFISSRQVEQGLLRNYRVAMLPGIRALSALENAELARLAQRGHVFSTAKADGYFDEHGRPTSAPAWLEEASVRLFDGSFPRAELAEVLPATDATPVVKLVAKKGDPRAIEGVGYRYGKAEIIALLCRPDGEDKIVKAVLHLPREGFVYDMLRSPESSSTPVARRSGKKSVKLARGEAALFAVLPYEVTRLHLVAPPMAQAGRRLPLFVAVETRNGVPGEHIVHVEIVQEATGKVLRHYSKNMVCGNGEGRTYIPLALNERPGRYTIVAHDVLSGKRARASISVIH